MRVAIDHESHDTEMSVPLSSSTDTIMFTTSMSVMPDSLHTYLLQYMTIVEGNIVDCLYSFADTILII